MKTKFSGIMTLFLALLVQFTFAQDKTISGKVSDETGVLPGVSVLIKGTTTGTETDFDGKYTIKAKVGDVLQFSYVGMKTAFKTVGSSNTINVILKASTNVLNEVVVTALGIKREAKTLSYATQTVKGKELNLTEATNFKTALAGKVAGVQIVGQAGSKLGDAGRIRIRGAISLTQDGDPLYVVDGVPTDPNNIDMDNVASLNVLKGPNATALYGQRADAGVIVITTKKGSSGLGVDVVNSITFEKVAYLPKYQNLYGGGYEGEASFGTFNYNGGSGPFGAYNPAWSVLDGVRHLTWDNNYADESWGPKFDNKPYAPWYSWWPGTTKNPNPYYGKTASYSAQPNNVKDFYDTGVTLKNYVAVYGGNDKFHGRISFTDLDQNGITPYTSLKKQFVSTKFDYNVSDKFNVGVNVDFATSNVLGNFNDGYGNQTSGSFNSWFNRNIDTGILKQLKDLQTTEGYSASWNWWGPNYSTLGGGFRKPAFWFNPYTFMERYKVRDKNEDLVGSFRGNYKIDKNWSIKFMGSRSENNRKNGFKFPYSLSFSAAPELYNAWSNSFGVFNSTTFENNFMASLNYKKDFGDFDVKAFIGGNLRENGYDRLSALMNPGAKTGGLIIPDVYTFANAGEIPTPVSFTWRKKVRSIYANASFGYKDYLYLDASYRKDWSSALPANNNGYAYPSVGTSFIFTNLMDNKKILSFGKFRTSWAQVGNDVGALLINPVNPLSQKPYNGLSLMYTPTTLVDPNIKPALNSSFEAGLDLKFFDNRYGLSLTYYKENRKDEIVPVSISRGTGYNSFLTNAGETQRTGVEVTLNAAIFKSTDFKWNATLNWATNNTQVLRLAAGLNAMDAPGGSGAFGFISMVHELGNKWGQIKGTGIKRDASGTPVLNSNGTFVTQPGQYFGSVLPDFTGGIINTFSYKGVTLTAVVDFQKGGKFFSLSEMWGNYSGLDAATAAINDKGKNVRDDVSAGGGVHVVGVSATGSPIDMYVDNQTYFKQWFSNRLAEPFVHNASFVKLREVSLTYSLPKSILKGQNAIKGINLSIIGRNLWLISVAKDNKNRWDPSELSNTYGENGQLPGTRSYGVNLKITF